MLPTMASFANLLKGVIERAFELLKLGAKVKWYTTCFFPIIGLNAASQHDVKLTVSKTYSTLTRETLSSAVPRNCFLLSLLLRVLMDMWLSDKSMESA